MKLPSLRQVLQDAAATFMRFPLVLINTALGTICVVLLIDHEGPARATVLFNIMAATLAGIPLLTALALFSEKRKQERLPAAALQAAGIILLVIYGWSLPSNLAEAPAFHILRLLFILTALHLLVTFAPFYRRGEINGFWHFNKILFLRLMLTMIYTTVLYSGLALALAALDNLFAIDVPGKRYAELWFILLGLFTTWSFLAGIPENLDELEQSTDYPKVIKIFAQYILSPLVLVYLLILYAYIIRILIVWDWPQGWVGRLILGFAASGIFTLLLLHPIRNKAENNWINRAAHWFYWLMLPVVGMLLLALWRRVSEYGVTEGRYIGIGLGFWLAGIVLYFIISRKKSIKTIPVSLTILTLLISFGPWSAFSVSERSQSGRLQEILSKNHLLADGLVQKTAQPVSQEDSRQISSILSYLHDIHGYQQIQPWFKETLTASSSGKNRRYKDPAQVAKMMGVEYQNVRYRAAGDMIRLRSDQSTAIDVGGYSHLIRGQYFSERNDKRNFTNRELQIQVRSDLETIRFYRLDKEINGDSLLVDLRPLISQLITDYPNVSVNNIPSEKMMLSAANPYLTVKIFFRLLSLKQDDGVYKPFEYSMDILYRLTKE